jgi:Zn-dependent protease
MFGNFDPIRFVYLAVALLFSLSFHEFSHAYVADRLGDPTARYMGRLTLNPLAHLDPTGTLFMLIALMAGIGIGWAKPVPFNPNNLRGNYRTGIGLVAVAGPGANLLLAITSAIIAQVLILFRAPNVITLLFIYLVVVNVSLMLFNLIPLPPLDGAKVLIGLLGRFRGRWAYELGNQVMDLERYGMMPLFVLLIINSVVPILSAPLGFVSNFIINFLLH